MENTSINAAVTPEILEQGIRLAEIMMPHAMRQTRAFFQRESGQTHGRLVHYTSAEAALNIIRTKRFWMRNTNCMSDYREVQHGVDILNAFFNDPAKKKSFVEALDGCVPDVAFEAFSVFNNWWSDIRLRSYIACLSEHQDNEDRNGRLSMWRAFGGTATRIAIVLKVPYLSLSILALSVTFSPVAYLSQPAVHEVMEEIIANISANREYLRGLGRDSLVQLVFRTLLSSVVCLKHEGFHEEKEWRAIHTPHMWSSRLMESSTEIVGGVPQIVYKVPLDAKVSDEIADLDFTEIVDRLIIGPTSYPWPIYEALVGELTKAGVADASERVLISEIPIRG